MTDQEILRQFRRGRGVKEIAREAALRERCPPRAALARVERVICAGVMERKREGQNRDE